MAKTTSSRGYVFTENNPKITKEEYLQNLKSAYPSTFMYCCISKEKGKQGTEHLQGYIEFKNPVPFESIKKNIPTAHIEKRKGKPTHARDYVFKTGDYKESAEDSTTLEQAIEDGDFPKGQGKRSDLDDIAELLEQGEHPSLIRKQYPSQYLRYKAHIHSLYQEILEEKFQSVIRDINVFYVFGESRTGKTSGIYKYYGMEDVYRVSNYDNAFDSYSNQDVIVLEEYHSNITMSYLLQLLEGYPMKLKARYNDKTACFTKVFIVSNKSLDQQYKNIQEESINTYNAFLNRIDYSIHVKGFDDVVNSLNWIYGKTESLEDVKQMSIVQHKNRY